MITEFRIENNSVIATERNNSFIEKNDVRYFGGLSPLKILSVKIDKYIVCTEITDEKKDYVTLKKKFYETFGTKIFKSDKDVYLISKKINEGKFGNVYELYSLENNKIVIGKHSNDAKKEYDIIKQLNNLKVYEYIDKYNLFVMEKGEKFVYPKSTTKKIEYFNILCKNIKKIHDLGYIHCDIKPSNIIMIDGKPTIIDFGLAHKINDVSPNYRGTMYFMNKESCLGFSDQSRDIWALCMSFAFLELNIPFHKYIVNKYHNFNYTDFDNRIQEYINLISDKVVKGILEKCIYYTDIDNAIFLTNYF